MKVNRRAAGLAVAFSLVLGGAVLAPAVSDLPISSAEAVTGTSVYNSYGTGSYAILILRMNGQQSTLYPGYTARDVNKIHVPPNKTFVIEGNYYSGGITGKWVTLYQKITYDVYTNIY